MGSTGKNRAGASGFDAMRSGTIPFKFDISGVLKKLQRAGKGRVGGVTLSLPFVSIAASPKNREKQAAREIVIRLKDRRVLSAWECCDNCIDEALTSLQEIRRLLVDKQVELSDLQDGPLYLLIEAMAVGIRQFLTFEQRLAGAEDYDRSSSDFRRHPEIRQSYFDGLETLRGHLSRCLAQIAAIAKMDMPTGGVISHYQGDWQIKAYEPLKLADKPTRD